MCVFSPGRGSPEAEGRPPCFDISPARLAAMSPAELTRSLELALGSMTEETYDSAVIDAYLEALEGKLPLPWRPDAAAAWAQFRRGLEPGGEARPRRPSLRRMVRMGLAAAAAVLCLLLGGAAAQASGADLLGAIAQWTDSVFHFTGPEQAEAEAEGTLSLQPETPEPYRPFQEELDQLGLFLCAPVLPDGFQVESLYYAVTPETGQIDLSVSYRSEEGSVLFNLSRQGGTSSTLYEKDGGEVLEYQYGGVRYYQFTNLDQTVAAWSAGDYEYALSTDLPEEVLWEIIQASGPIQIMEKELES